MAGDDLPGVIRHFGDKVFMVHVRDIATKPQGPPTPEIEKRWADLGYLEVPFGIGTIRALKDIHIKARSTPSTSRPSLAITPPVWPGPSAISAPSTRPYRKGGAGHNRPCRPLLSLLYYSDYSSPYCVATSSPSSSLPPSIISFRDSSRWRNSALSPSIRNL